MYTISITIALVPSSQQKMAEIRNIVHPTHNYSSRIYKSAEIQYNVQLYTIALVPSQKMAEIIIHAISIVLVPTMYKST